MLTMELPGKRKWGRPKRRFMDVVREDMAVVEVTEEDTEEQMKMENPLWRPLTGEAERRRKQTSIGSNLMRCEESGPLQRCPKVPQSLQILLLQHHKC